MISEHFWVATQLVERRTSVS